MSDPAGVTEKGPGFTVIQGRILTSHIIRRKVTIPLGLLGLFDEPPVVFLAIIPIAVIGITLGILGIIVGVRLLGLSSGNTSYFKVYAWLSIAAGVCFVTFILTPLGGLIDAAGNIVLAMLFLKSETDEVHPDFV